MLPSITRVDLPNDIWAALKTLRKQDAQHDLLQFQSVYQQYRDLDDPVAAEFKRRFERLDDDNEDEPLVTYLAAIEDALEEIVAEQVTKADEVAPLPVKQLTTA